MSKKKQGLLVLTSGSWWNASLTRAVKTFCQTFIAVIAGAAMFSGVDWGMVASAAGLAFVLSLVTSLGGLPEVEE